MDAVAPPLVVELRLEPQPGGDGSVHVAGTVSADGHPARTFSGWMALLQALEALVLSQK